MEHESSDPTRSLMELQRQLFELWEDFFVLVAGKPASRFADFEAVRASTIHRATEIQKSRNSIEEQRAKIARFYHQHSADMFATAKQLGGIRMVLGGGRTFAISQLDSVRKLALYADTVLIPDPVLQWIEVDRSEEKFSRVLELRDMYHCLLLRPLVDAELPYPAIAVVPSWEKTLERHDSQTQKGQGTLVTTVLAFHLGLHLDNVEDFFAYAAEKSDEFLAKVSRSGLFLPPGHEGEPPSAQDAARLYREYMKTWRSDQYARVAGLSDSGVVAAGLVERIAPQFHLFENAEELGSHPLLSLPVHWHYFDMCRAAFAGKLNEVGLLDPGWSAIERALHDPSLIWLGNVPIDDLVRLRRDNENEAFRRHLDEMAGELRAAPVEAIGKVAPEIVRGLHGLMAEHQKRVREVEEDYHRRHSKTAVFTLATGIAVFAPALAPVIGIVPGAAAAIAAAAKYASEKIDERAALRQLSRSLLGVLAATAKK